MPRFIFITRKNHNENFILQKNNPHHHINKIIGGLTAWAIVGPLVAAMLSTNLPNDTTTIESASPTIEIAESIPVSQRLMPVTYTRDFSKELAIYQSLQQMAEQKQEDEFDNLIYKYSTIFGLNYDEVYLLVKEQEDEVKSDYINVELGVLTIITGIYKENKTIDKSPIKSDISTEEREQLLLKYASIYGLNDVDTIATLLAVYRLETGRGTSNACVKKNNFGGLRAQGKNGYYILSYRSPEIGAIAMVRTFVSIMNKSINSKYYNPNKSLEHNMNRIYCGAPEWAVQVGIIKKEVLKDYDLEQYIQEVQEEKGAQLAKK